MDVLLRKGLQAGRIACALGLSMSCLAAGLQPAGADAAEPALTGAEQTRVELTLVGGQGLNPNAQGRASPVVVRVFDLASTQAFDSSDYATLFENDAGEASRRLMPQEELVLRPGDIVRRERAVAPGTTAVGVAAAFRNLEGSAWHVAVPLVPGRRNLLLVDLHANRVRAVQAESVPQAGSER